jgi:hypothetical protein
MPMQSVPQTFAIVMLATLALVACTSDRNLWTDPFATTQATPEPPRPAPPPIDMAGRWMLASPSGGPCGMNFTSAAGATQGRIRPEGGCPGNFFTSRQWAFEQGALVIYDHKQQQLARLAASEPPGRFEGAAASGIQVTLSR